MHSGAKTKFCGAQNCHDTEVDRLKLLLCASEGLVATMSHKRIKILEMETTLFALISWEFQMAKSRACQNY
jgi:hypothetical protein